MGLLSRAIAWAQFKLGIYHARQITRIERGGLVISCADSRYQPDGGIRHELSPDEWLLFSWRFFPRDYRKEFYDDEFLLRERYYNYFAKTEGSRTNIYSIFKNKHNTGYFIVEYFGENRGDSTLAFISTNGESVTTRLHSTVGWLSQSNMQEAQ